MTKRLLLAKIQDEAKALQLCQSKVRQKKLPMEVIDAEYQWYVPHFKSCAHTDVHSFARLM
jgi:cell fate regulator YaaT (PSP1 superfamily)